MSIRDKLKHIAPMAALAATLIAPQAPAQNSEPATRDGATNIVHVSASDSMQWGNSAEAQRDRAIYESLPAEYKSFLGKSFMERMEMKEEWEQKDFLKRDRKRSNLLRRNPNATIGDLVPGASMANLPLADYPTASLSYSEKILRDEIMGNLTMAQGKIAREMITLGRPLSSIDKSLPLADQYAAAGLDVLSQIAAGRTEASLTARERSMYVAQVQDAESLNDRSEDAWRDLRIRLGEEENAEWEANHGFLDRLFGTKTRLLSEEEMKGMFPREVINGKDVGIRQPNEVSYSVHDEVTRKIAAKIDAEEKAQSKALKSGRDMD